MSDPDFSIIENNELITLFSDILSPEDIREIKEVMKSAVLEMPFSPNTAKMRIEEIMLSKINKIPPDILTIKLASKMIENPNILSNKSFIQEENNELFSSSEAITLNQFLIKAFSQNPEILPLIFKGAIPLDVTTIFAANPMLSIVINPNTSHSITPEMLFRMLSNGIYTTAELHYNPLLKIILEITRKLSNKNNGIPNELGKVMSECNDLWRNNYPELLCLLDDKIRIIRNSEAHKDTIIDVRNQTITFINRKAKGDNEILGPLKQDEFAPICDFPKFCVDLNTAFRVAERKIKEQL